jgi:DMSO/TMAO reductase YedYZ molybdopterin-dependent catalytic subunit
VALAALLLASKLDTAIHLPPAALGDAFIRVTPSEIVIPVLTALGVWAKRLILVGVVVVTLLAAAEIAVRTARDGSVRRVPAAGCFAALLLLEYLLQPPVTSSHAVGVAAALAAGVAFGAALGLLGTRRAASPLLATDEPRRARGTRRELIFDGAVLGLTLAGGLGAARAIGGGVGEAVLACGAGARRVAVPPDPRFPRIAGLPTRLTTADDHYVVDINLNKPALGAGRWSLEVDGLVAAPLRLRLADLTCDFPVREEVSVLTCIDNQVGGHLVGSSSWRGVGLADVLAAAHVRAPEDAAVVLRGADGYVAEIPLRDALHPSALLAFAQDGRPLTRSHGAPCRLRVPAFYGVKNVKWITSIEIVEQAEEDYWTSRGWDRFPRVRMSARIDVAGEDGSARAGVTTWIAGVAWAGTPGVERVEVTTDGGETWREAQLEAPAGEASWRRWAFRWTPPAAGRATVGCRAVDGDGVPQDRRERVAFPGGSSGYHLSDVYVS